MVEKDTGARCAAAEGDCGTAEANTPAAAGFPQSQDIATDSRCGAQEGDAAPGYAAASSDVPQKQDTAPGSGARDISKSAARTKENASATVHTPIPKTVADMAALFAGYLAVDPNASHSHINDWLCPTFETADIAAMSATLRFPLKAWESNRVGILHGGVISTMLDRVCGLTVSAFIGHWAPTMSMQIDFIRSASIDDGDLLCMGIITALGRRLIRTRGELVRASDGKLIAACTATFFNKED